MPSARCQSCTHRENSLACCRRDEDIYGALDDGPGGRPTTLRSASIVNPSPRQVHAPACCPAPDGCLLALDGCLLAPHGCFRASEVGVLRWLAAWVACAVCWAVQVAVEYLGFHWPANVSVICSLRCTAPVHRPASSPPLCLPLQYGGYVRIRDRLSQADAAAKVGHCTRRCC